MSNRSTWISSKVLSKLFTMAFVLLLLFTFFSFVVGFCHVKRNVVNINYPSSFKTYKTFNNHRRVLSRISSPKMSTSVGDASDNDKTDDPVVKNEKSNGLKNMLSSVTNKFKFSNTNKESLAKLGMYVLLSYGFVSNFSSITCLIISWVIFGKTKGVSPLAPGQWKGLLGVYAGIWAANNFLRPIRISIALFIAPYFEKIIQSVENKTGWKRSIASAVVVFLINIVGTISYLCTGLFLATTLTGVPLFPK